MEGVFGYHKQMIARSRQTYVARQPILDANGKLFAYELLFRGGCKDQSGPIDDALRATAQVLENALNNMGLQKLVGSHKAFINCSRDMLLSGMLFSLDPKRFVLEILESVQFDAEVLSALASLQNAGYEMALDDFVYSPESMRQVLPIVPFLRYVKLDLLANPVTSRWEATRWFRSRGVVVLAEKVETEADFQTCRQDGCELFQGYFFARPELISSNKIDSRTAGILRILQVLRNDPDVTDLEEVFKSEPEVTLNLLRYMNSAAIALRNPVSSVRQAITLVGLRNLEQWLMLMLYARDANGADSHSPLFENAAHRARLMEGLARYLDPSGVLAEKAFLVGIMSRMDALCRVPMRLILHDLELGADIVLALNEGQGVLGQLLLLVAALESGADGPVSDVLRVLELGDEVFRTALEESYC